MQQSTLFVSPVLISGTTYSFLQCVAKHVVTSSWNKYLFASKMSALAWNFLICIYKINSQKKTTVYFHSKFWGMNRCFQRLYSLKLASKNMHMSVKSSVIAKRLTNPGFAMVWCLAKPIIISAHWTYSSGVIFEISLIINKISCWRAPARSDRQNYVSTPQS